LHNGHAVCSTQAYTIILLDLTLYVALVSSTAHSYGSFSWIIAPVYALIYDLPPCFV